MVDGLVFAVVDFAICATLTTLYCRRLLIFIHRLNTRFLNNANNPPGLEADQLFFKIMVKSTVLTFVAMVSTQITIILCWILGIPTLWLALDSVINSWCMILIFDLYDELFNLYPRCCCLCEKVVSYYCIAACACNCFC